MVEPKLRSHAFDLQLLDDALELHLLLLALQAAGDAVSALGWLEDVVEQNVPFLVGALAEVGQPGKHSGSTVVLGPVGCSERGEVIAFLGQGGLMLQDKQLGGLCVEHVERQPILASSYIKPLVMMSSIMATKVFSRFGWERTKIYCETEMLPVVYRETETL